MTPIRPQILRSVSAGLAAVALTAFVSLSAAGAPRGPSEENEAPSLVFSVIRLDPEVLTNGDSLAVRVEARNVGLSPAEGLSVSLLMTTEPLTDRSLLGSWEQGDLDVATGLIAQASPGKQGVIAAGETAWSSLTVPSAALGLPEGETAVYGLTVAFDGPTGRLADIHTFVTWSDDEPRITPVAVIVLGSGSTERVDALVDTLEYDEVTFAVDPAMLSPTALDQLAGFDTYLLPAYNVDLGSLARAGSSGILDRALSKARSIAPLSLTFAPWIGVAANVDQSVVSLASDRGAAAVVSLPALSTTTPELGGYDGGLPPSLALAYADGKAVPILLPDPSLSAALVAGPPGSVTTPARVIAETALLSAANPSGAPVLVVVGPSWTIESSHRSNTFSALVDSPWAELTPISSVLNSSPATIDLPSTAVSDTDIPVPLLTSAGSSLRALDALALATSDPTGFSETLANQVLSAVSFDRRADTVSRDEALGQAIFAIDEIRSSVSLPGSSTLTLISTSGNIPVTVTNNLEVDITARIVLESGSLILRIEDRPEVTLPAGMSTQVLVPVTAVSSGNVTIRVSLENAEGTRLTPVSEYSLRIRAAWGDLFTIIVASLGMVLLVAGTIRTIRRGRADTRQGPSSGPANGAS